MQLKQGLFPPFFVLFMFCFVQKYPPSLFMAKVPAARRAVCSTCNRERKRLSNRFFVDIFAPFFLVRPLVWRGAPTIKMTSANTAYISTRDIRNHALYVGHTKPERFHRKKLAAHSRCRTSPWICFLKESIFGDPFYTKFLKTICSRQFVVCRNVKRGLTVREVGGTFVRGDSGEGGGRKNINFLLS